MKNTFDNVQLLVQTGLVELKRTKDIGGKTAPKVDYDKIVLEISV